MTSFQGIHGDTECGHLRLRFTLGAEEALGCKEDAHRIPERGERGPESQRIDSTADRQDVAARGQGAACTGHGQAASQRRHSSSGVGRTERRNRIHLGAQDKEMPLHPHLGGQDLQSATVRGDPPPTPGMSEGWPAPPEAAVHFADRPGQAYGGQEGEPERPRFVSAFISPESCSPVITSDCT